MGVKNPEDLKLDTFKRNILGRMYGPCRGLQTEERRTRYNEELQNLFQRPCIMREVTKRRLTWAEHAL